MPQFTTDGVTVILNHEHDSFFGAPEMGYAVVF